MSKKLTMKISKYLQRKKIVHSKKYAAAEFVRLVKDYKGNRFIRVAFTNKVAFFKTIPMTDIPINDVVIIEKLPSLLVVKLFKLVGKKAKRKIIFNNRIGIVKNKKG